ncbi:nucleoside diphosphate kinase homolog 5 [Fopius arisanus]|uniref:Nucleoside diphosphate kinase homolog 5 n=2 Tax=Fopius arisanus TaxID=64838 RepID=A0A9R1TUG9_9HYME|nr:PREDICTED: nucleoside diphosphate kinase homolog 5-like [Fopius arisanus]
MCSNFFQRITQNLALGNIKPPYESTNNERDACNSIDWSNIKIPRSASSVLKLSLEIPNNSVQVDNSTQCYCNDAQNGNDICGDEICEEWLSKFKKVAVRKAISNGSDFPSEEEDERLDVECTLAIIKPGALEYRNSIKKRIIDAGFEICGERTVQLTTEQAAEFYYKEYGKLHFPLLAVHLSSGPIVALVLGRNGAIKEWRRLMGPKDVKQAKLYFPSSIRALYGEDGDDVENVVHGSRTIEDARDEICFFFPNFVVEPIIERDYIPDYFRKTLIPTLINGLAQLKMDKPNEPLLWLANWIQDNHPDNPKISK